MKINNNKMNSLSYLFPFSFYFNVLDANYYDEFKMKEISYRVMVFRAITAMYTVKQHFGIEKKQQTTQHLSKVTSTTTAVITLTSAAMASIPVLRVQHNMTRYSNKMACLIFEPSLNQ